MNKESENKAPELSFVAAREEEILRFWQDNKIFEKTVEKCADADKEFVFYDGPPFATGLPHYGHITAGTMKDAFPRYYTMKGYQVKRRWGWDCHGLPVENLIEASLDLKSKKDIEEYGIGNFNKKARESVMTYADDWKKIVPRLGRFVDMENDYKTMDWTYSESVWWIFHTLFNKGLIYEGYKAMQICPRCETTLSNFEVNLGYQDITDISATVKFELIDPGSVGLLKDTYILAWTTTPWTLPGNVALAINPEILYSSVLFDGKRYVVADSLVEKIFQGKEYQKERSVSGKGLLGAKYKPVFDYYQDPSLANFERGWKIYGADFVTTEDGTGVVHIAPAFGEDDMKLGQAESLPFVQHVAMNGHFKPEVKDFAERAVKPKDDHQATDIEIIKWLAGNEKLFAKEKIVHSYPHCWRCKTPLLNYATSSWFVRVTDFKDKLVQHNQSISWVPEHIKEGRFGNWLEGARDWAISRSRYWGAPIPVWKCSECKEMRSVGSVAELGENIDNHHNHYFLMRHGEAENNVSEICSTKADNPHHLTEKGRAQVKKTAESLVDKKIDLIISSDFVRARETAEIVAESLGIDADSIIFDQRIREVDEGVFNGKPLSEFRAVYKTTEEKLLNRPEGGESLTDVKLRTGEFLYELEKKHEGRNILIVSHDDALCMLNSAAKGLNHKEIVAFRSGKNSFFNNGEIKELDFSPLPHNENYDLDLHRPYIDEVEFPCPCGGAMKRVPEVFDCWFESGSMPYGQAHYPFESEDIFNPDKNIGFPADFIAEGLDQTRGWFYSMLVLSTALFDKSSYKNVIVNGMVLAEDGQKMSKSLKNYPDPMDVVNKYGADALRFYLLSSPLVRAEEVNFSEKGVGEIYRKIVQRLNNVYSFYQMYVGEDEVEAKDDSPAILDTWILARLNELISSIDKSMKAYVLDRAVRPIDDFIDDLSNWYVRRSRDRFKSEDAVDRQRAIQTTRFVLTELSKVLAPFMPFIAEDIYGRVAGVDKKESVHLADWPEAKDFDQAVLDKMIQVRKLVEVGLALRDKAGIKVRQPLGEVVIGQDYTLSEDHLAIAKDELNVKKISQGPLPDDGNWQISSPDSVPVGSEVCLGLEISEDLRQEGLMRELVRSLQEERKKSGLSPSDRIKLSVKTDEAGQGLLNRFQSEILKAVSADMVIFEDNEGRELKIGDILFSVVLKR